MKTKSTQATSIHKVRRDVRGGKRGDGHHRHRRVRRADPTRIRLGDADATLTGAAGLVGFGAFCVRNGVDRDLRRLFFRLKDGVKVVYPMEAQLRLLLDANVAGETRVFGLESLAADPLFVRLAGGVVPSLDTVYRDLCRFDEQAITDLEAMMFAQGVAGVRRRRLGTNELHLDVDTTVECVFGHQEGALPGPNPHYHGRPSYHPMLVYCAEADACVGAILRPGNTGLGEHDAPVVGAWLNRFRRTVGAGWLITMRIDAGGDCAAILQAAHDAGVRFIAKAKLTADLCGAIMTTAHWTTVERDPSGKPTRQVATIDFRRSTWRTPFRLVAMRTNDRDSGKQVHLWSDLDYSVHAFITNDWEADADDIAWEYDGRAEVEPAIAELKNGWGIGKIPSQAFAANHAMLLLKLLAHNLMRRFVRWIAPHLAYWRVHWLRRALINIPGRLLRSGRRWTLRVPPQACIRLE